MRASLDFTQHDNNFSGKNNLPEMLRHFIYECEYIPIELLEKFTQNIELQFSQDLKEIPINISLEDLFEKYPGLMRAIEWLADSMKIYNPSFGDLSTKLFVLRQRLLESRSMLDTLGNTEAIFQTNYIEYVTSNYSDLDAVIQSDRDFIYNDLYSVIALKTYSVKNSSGDFIESIQQIYLRAAIWVALSERDDPNINDIKKWYDLFSTKRVAPPSPVMANSGINIGQYATCFTQSDHGDTSVMQNNISSLKNGGHGMLLAWFDNVKDTTLAVRRTIWEILKETFRPPVVAYYLSPDQDNFEDFLRLRDPLLSEEETVRDSHIAVWMPDAFMKAVENNDDWHQFTPEDTLKLNKKSGEEYYELHTQLIQENKHTNIINARELMEKIVNMQRRSWEPYIVFKDTVNARSNENNVWPIQLSSLCAEVVQYTDSETSSICNVLTIGLPEFIIEKDWCKDFDWEGLIDASKDTQFFMDVLSEDQLNSESEMIHEWYKFRALGMGAQGLHTAMQILGIAYDSEEWIMFNKKVYEHIYYWALLWSVNEAKKKGKYSHFDWSHFSKGELQFDLAEKLGLEVELTIDSKKWDHLKEEIIEHWTRNSQLTSQPPAVFWSRIFGNSKWAEALQTNMFVAKDWIWEYWEVNKNLIEELVGLGLWDDEMINSILMNSWSVQSIDKIPQDIKERYKTVWEIPEEVHIAMSATRSPFIDQSESRNSHMRSPSSDELIAKHLLSWKLWLKTAQYYLKQKPWKDAVKVSLVSEKDEVWDLDTDMKSFLEPMVQMFWTEDEIEYNKIRENFNSLSKWEQKVIKRILAFFAVWDDIVQENISDNFLQDVAEQSELIWMIYKAQDHQERVHELVYKNLLKAVCDIPLDFDETKRESFSDIQWVAQENESDEISNLREFKELLYMYEVENNPINEKVAFAKKFMNTESCSRQKRLLAFICAEWIMFSSSFAYLFHLKEKHWAFIWWLGTSNDFIARDESLHTDVWINLLLRDWWDLENNEAREIIKEAAEIEQEFTSFVLNDGGIWGMSDDAMRIYVEFVADSICTRLGLEKIYYVDNPLIYMDKQGAATTSDFMWLRWTEYQATEDKLRPWNLSAHFDWISSNVINLLEDTGFSAHIKDVFRTVDSDKVCELNFGEVADWLASIDLKELSTQEREDFFQKLSDALGIDASEARKGDSCITCSW